MTQALGTWTPLARVVTGIGAVILIGPAASLLTAIVKERKIFWKDVTAQSISRKALAMITVVGSLIAALAAGYAGLLFGKVAVLGTGSTYAADVPLLTGGICCVISGVAAMALKNSRPQPDRERERA